MQFRAIGQIHLLEGQVWKYGETTNFQNRYSDLFLGSTGQGPDG